MSGPISLGFAGAGEVDLENVKALLNDWLGYGEEDEDGYPAQTDREITIYIPASEESMTPALQTVLDWIDYVDVPYILVTDEPESRKVRKLVRNAQDLVTTNNVGHSLINVLDAAQGEKYLVLLWGEGDEFSEMVLDLASASNIPAKDLTAGLDDIAFVDEDPDDSFLGEQDEEPEEEKPAPKSKKKQREEELVDEEEPLEETSTDEEIPAEKSQGEWRLQSVSVVGQQEDEREYSVKEVLTLVLGYLHAQERLVAISNLSEPMPSKLTSLVASTITKLDSEASPEATGATESQDPGSQVEADTLKRERGRGGRPRKDGTPAQPRDEDAFKVAFIKDEDGNYRRRGRGRPKKGEEVVLLSQTEIEELGLDDDE